MAIGEPILIEITSAWNFRIYNRSQVLSTCSYDLKSVILESVKKSKSKFSLNKRSENATFKIAILRV